MHNCIDIYVNVYFKRYKFFVQYKTKRYGTECHSVVTMNNG